MNTNPKINGIHHITAIASSAVENAAFYTNVLGLRLVKKTVNFDDPYTYHLYYGDSAGSPGTILTFFPWENLPQGKIGAGMVISIAFSIPIGSVDYWIERLNAYGIEPKETKRFGDRTIQFADPHGLSLELIGTSKRRSTFIWKEGPIPSNHCIMGFHSATTLLRSFEKTRFLLVDIMGMVLDAQDGIRYRFKMKNGDDYEQFYDVVIDARAEYGRQGGGTVHHIAFRMPPKDGQKYWQKLLMDSGFSVTPIRDRKYFKSVYFHEPGGVLFELATDMPGFTVDENRENLGHDLQLPDQYESMRAEIENRLPKLEATEFDHEIMRPDLKEDDDMITVASHSLENNKL